MTTRHLGTWTLARTIHDAAAGTSIICTGRAEIRKIADHVRYDETVTLEIGGRPIHATRAYISNERRGVIAVTFADGRPFFRAPIESDGIMTAIHYCGRDVYTGSLDFGRPERWEMHWRVSGSKSLQILTSYTRAASPARTGTSELGLDGSTDWAVMS
jgi:hypothetical protein